MKVLIEALLPRIAPNLPFLCVTHEGKQDLERSIPRKLRGWRVPRDRFVILRDNDGGDCLALKARLAEMCRNAGRSDALIRIPCQELEAWYIGDPKAVAIAFDDSRLANQIQKLAKGDPDGLQHPSARLEQVLPAFQKISGARRMAKHLDPDGNSSPSFRVFVQGVRRLADSMAAEMA